MYARGELNSQVNIECHKAISLACAFAICVHDEDKKENISSNGTIFIWGFWLRPYRFKGRLKTYGVIFIQGVTA